jgi:hypothetical protein
MAVRRRKLSPQPRLRVSERTGFGPGKAELREQASEAVATYGGPITRCPPKQRMATRRERNQL